MVRRYIQFGISLIRIDLKHLIRFLTRFSYANRKPLHIATALHLMGALRQSNFYIVNKVEVETRVESYFRYIHVIHANFVLPTCNRGIVGHLENSKWTFSPSNVCAFQLTPLCPASSRSIFNFRRTTGTRHIAALCNGFFDKIISEIF